MARMNIERQNQLEPRRMHFAKNELYRLGYELKIDRDKKIEFIHNGYMVTLFPYSGWFSGKSVIAGRGIENLIKQLINK